MFAALAAAAVSGCEAMKGLGINVGDFGRDSEAMVGGGAKAGQDYITGLSMSENARQYFTSAAASSAQPVTVSRGNDNGTGVTWTDDGGIVIPPGTTIQFANKGYCMDPHLPAPKAGDEMQFVKTSSLVPNQLRGTYKNLLERAANGDSEVQNNMQRLVWALRTAGSEDGYANNLTDRQRQILAECADENGSFESYQLMHKAIGKHLDWAKSKIDKWTGKVNDALQIKVGNFSYNALDLLDPDKAQQRVGEHLQTLIAQSVNLPVSKSGFNYGELAQGVYTDVKGNGTLSFQAKVANATSQPYTFYPMDYAAQVGSGRSQSTTAYYASSDDTMRQRITDLPVNRISVIHNPDFRPVQPSEDNERKHQSEDIRQRENVANRLNDLRNLFPDANALPPITADMIVIDPTRFSGNEEMKYDADNNRFILKRDITESSSVFATVWNALLDNTGGYSEDARQTNALLHELAHFYQDKLVERNQNAYYDMNASSVASVTRAEAFAVMMSIKLSEAGPAMVEHAGQGIGDTGVTYPEAVARSAETLAAQQKSPELKNTLQEIASRCRYLESLKVENASYKAQVQSDEVKNLLQKVPMDALTSLIRK